MIGPGEEIAAQRVLSKAIVVTRTKQKLGNSCRFTSERDLISVNTLIHRDFGPTFIKRLLSKNESFYK